jgi:hypothetical protein
MTHKGKVGQLVRKIRSPPPPRWVGGISADVILGKKIRNGERQRGGYLKEQRERGHK